MCFLAFPESLLEWWPPRIDRGCMHNLDPQVACRLGLAAAKQACLDSHWNLEMGFVESSRQKSGFVANYNWIALASVYELCFTFFLSCDLTLTSPLAWNYHHSNGSHLTYLNAFTLGCVMIHTEKTSSTCSMRIDFSWSAERITSLLNCDH